MVFLISLVVLGPATSIQAGPPQVGDPAPDFALVDQRGATVRLRDFRGKKRVVLAFYIKAFTPT
jgi:peroxiredoxin